MITVIAIILSFSAICHGRSTEEPCPFVSNEVTANDVQDVIVVGGGAAGTFAAWRLQHSKIVSRVLLLEATNRIGGRLYTEHVPGIDYQMAELGGMRYFPDFHPYMKNLITRLQLETKVFQMDEDNERRPWFLRNRFFQQKDMKSVGNGAYQLREDEKSKNPEDVTRMYFNGLVPEEQRSKPPDQMSTIFGVPLLNYGLANMFDFGNGSLEAYKYTIDAAGYDPTFDNPNAASMLKELFSNSGNISVLTPVKGMGAIPIQLALNFTDSGGRIEMNNTVTEIDKCSISNGSDVYVLSAYNYATGEEATYYSKKVILALTKSQLKRIRWKALTTFSQTNLLDSVVGHVASKFILAFDRPWWRQESLLYLNLTKGRSISTLPTRQTYYFEPSDPQVTNHSFILLYNDGKAANYWSPLVAPVFKPFSGMQLPSIFPVTEALVGEALKQIAVNHNTTEDIIGRPYFAAFMIWNHDHTPVNIPGYGPYMPS
jgi:uncharacterized protein with NAD-binding domain and iron-sulfur cluster